MMGCLVVVLIGIGVLAAAALAKLMPETEVFVAAGITSAGALVMSFALASRKVKVKWKIICTVIGVALIVGGIWQANRLHENKPSVSAAEQFSEKFNVSTELAESLEKALGATEYQYTLDDVAAWEQTYDWAAGERYNANLKRKGEDMHYLVVYVYEDQVASIREGAEFIYNDDGVNAAANDALTIG